MLRSFFLSVVLCLTTVLFASTEAPKETRSEGGLIVGKVLDSRTQQAVEYANITVYSASDSSLVTGGVTDTEGKFKIAALQPGAYYLTIKFIGYQEYKNDIFNITKEDNFIKIGQINLDVDAQNLSELDVVADKRQVLFKIDKKVINPSQFLAAQGGSAVDILANTPSVSVDIEGNVSMRGSSNFMVLINGKPTPFEASDALAQIPASSIENIEIITNPSAKYDPDGAAGIINIITKKKSQEGWNGIANASASTLGSYSGDFLFNFSGDNIQWYFGGNRSDRLRFADYSNASGTINALTGDTSHIIQEGERLMNFNTNALKTGFSYDINPKNAVGLEVQMGLKGRNFESDLNNKEWTTGGAIAQSFANADTKSDDTFGGFTLSQKTQFGDDKTHLLESSVFYQRQKGDESTFSNKLDNNDIPLVIQETWGNNTEEEWMIKTDYTRPWEKGKFEAGYQMKLDKEWSDYDAKFDTVADNSIFYSATDFYRLINSTYATFSGEQGQFGYQFGLRGEHTLRRLQDQDETIINEIKRMDWYPSLHFSYNLNTDQSFMASYTRRIDRPRSHYLDPYISWRDPNNVRKGTPELIPEYTNSYELSYQWRFDTHFLSVELFHRKVENKIERIRKPYQDGVLMSTYANTGEDFSTGIEMMLKYDLTPWWTANASASLYDYRLNVLPEYENSVYATQSNNWNARLSNTFKASPTLRLQFDAMYRSASVMASGKTSAMAFSSLAVKKSFFQRKLDVGVSVIDIFNTAKMERTSSSSSFYSNYTFDMKSPYLQFSLTYLFNNFQQDRKKRGESGGEGGSMEIDF